MCVCGGGGGGGGDLLCYKKCQPFTNLQNQLLLFVCTIHIIFMAKVKKLIKPK